MTARVLPSAQVDDRATLGEGTVVWDLAQVREGATLGRDCIIGRGAYVDAGVVVGDRCKVQNHALLYAPARLGDGVFVGPAVVLTNDHHPRAVSPDGRSKSAADWDPMGVVVEEGASLGARSVVLGGLTIGAWAMVGAGSVVTRSVLPHALVVGVPARQVGWVGRAGVALTEQADGLWRSAADPERYRLVEGRLEQLP